MRALLGRAHMRLSKRGGGGCYMHGRRGEVQWGDSPGTFPTSPLPPPQPLSSLMNSTGQRPWRTCSLRTAGRTRRCCGRSLEAPRASLATIPVGVSPSAPTHPRHPAHCPGACGVVDHSVGCGVATPARPAGPRQALPCQTPRLLSSRSHPMASPQENRPV